MGSLSMHHYNMRREDVQQPQIFHTSGQHNDLFPMIDLINKSPNIIKKHITTSQNITSFGILVKREITKSYFMA